MGVRMIADGDFDGASHGKGSKFVCMICGSPKRDGDVGVIELARDKWSDYDICVHCAVDIGGLVGMITEEKADELRKKNRAYGTKLKAAEEQVKALQRTVAAFLGPEDDS